MTEYGTYSYLLELTQLVRSNLYLHILAQIIVVIFIEICICKYILKWFIAKSHMTYKCDYDLLISK